MILLKKVGVVELVDTRDLKFLDSNIIPVQIRSPAPLNKAYRGVEQLAARRAHNPEVAGSSPAAATRKRGQKRFLVKKLRDFKTSEALG